MVAGVPFFSARLRRNRSFLNGIETNPSGIDISTGFEVNRTGFHPEFRHLFPVGSIFFFEAMATLYYWFSADPKQW